MYKDVDKQKEANRVANQRYREKVSRGRVSRQGITLTFKDLPLDVQADIEMMSRSHDAAGINDYESEKSLRTGRAIRHQGMFGVRPGTSVACYVPKEVK